MVLPDQRIFGARVRDLPPIESVDIALGGRDPDGDLPCHSEAHRIAFRYGNQSSCGMALRQARRDKYWERGSVPPGHWKRD